MKKNYGIACTLSSKDLEDRKNKLFSNLFSNIDKVDELENGYSFYFKFNDNTFSQITELIHSERKCCKFLRFDLHSLPNDGPVILDITGPEGTKALIRSMIV